MRIDVVTIFPEYLKPLELSLIGRAQEDGLLSVNVQDLREFTYDKHRTVDDTPYGGGAGMVMKPEPWGEALDRILENRQGDEKPLLLVPSPAGAVFNQDLAYALAEEEHLAFACGRYEGIDERVIEHAHENFRVLPVSIGDYVLNGGEVAVMVMVEAIARLIPGVIGNPDSLLEESHSDVLLEYPVYTKPAEWRGLKVPEVLLGGNHGKVARYRRDLQIQRTAARRPDLIQQLDPSTLNRKDRDQLWHAGFAVQDGKVIPKSQLDWGDETEPANTAPAE
ncbi:tRNA (guanosine(37)-N1)-methyltransferase TrmD [Glutamicibacter sp. X7]